MAIIFMDGFDHYGTSAARLLDGVYSSYESVTIKSTAARTGAYGIEIQCIMNDSGLRWRTPEPKSMIGVGFAFSISELPKTSDAMALVQALTGETAAIVTILISATGAVVARRGGRTGTIVAQSAAEVVLPGSFQHFECEFNDAAIEVRLNGVTVLNIADAGYTSLIEQFMIGGCYGYPKTGAGLAVMKIDDLYFRDDTGPNANTWVGDEGVYRRLMNVDISVDGWEPAVGADLFENINNVPPLDATEFIYASEADDKASFGMTPLPSNLISVTAVQISTRAWKTDSGDAKLSVGIGSGSSETMNDPHPVSNAARWFRDVFEVNPATGLRWLPSDLNAASAIVERTE